MKRLIALIIALMMITPVAAQRELPPPGLLPDHPFYGFKRFFERVHTWLTFDPTAKARVHLHYAEVRLAELNETIRRGRPEFAEMLKRDYESDMNETERNLNTSIALGRNVTALVEHVGNRTYRHILVLEKVLERVPEWAKIHIQHAINASIKGHEIAVKRIPERINRTAEMVRKFNCTVDADCRQLLCPMVLGHDTAICSEGRCKCGGKWEIVNKTEWRERFKEELTNKTQSMVQRIKESYNRSEIGEMVRQPTPMLPRVARGR